MMCKITKLSLMFLLCIGVLSGCGTLSKKEYKEDVSLKIVKSGVRIEEVRFDEDLGLDGKQVYKFTIPVEITGTFQHDCTIPVYYYFDMERYMGMIEDEASAWATEGQFKRVFRGKLKIKKGTTGIVYYEGETNDALMDSDATAYEQAWVAIRYDDGFISDNYAGVSNPFFNKEKYLYFRGAQSAYEEIRDIVPEEADGNVYVDENSITVEKTYTGNEPGNSQHYTVTATIRNDTDHPVETENLWVGCDYDMASPFNYHNCYEAMSEALTFMKGVGKPLGYTVQQKSITKSEDSVQVQFDMYNRYAGYSDSLMGSDLDWYQCFWISICLDDDNVNDNYVIVPNPYFDEEHYSNEKYWFQHAANDIYRYTTSDKWNELFK